MKLLLVDRELLRRQQSAEGTGGTLGEIGTNTAEKSGLLSPQNTTKTDVATAEKQAQNGELPSWMNDFFE